AAVDVHVVRHAGVDVAVGGEFYRRGRLAAEGGAAAGGEAHHVAAAGDLPGGADRIVAGRVHVDEAGLLNRLGVFGDSAQRGRAAVGGGAQRLLQNGGEAAGLVAGRRVVVHLASIALGVFLPPANALHQFLADRAVDGTAGEQVLGAIDLRRLGEHAG